SFYCPGFEVRFPDAERGGFLGQLDSRGMIAKLSLRGQPLDGVPGEMRACFDQRQILLARVGGLRVVHGERTQNLILGIPYGHAPAGSQAEGPNLVARSFKARVGLDIFDYYGLVEIGSRSARAHIRADG